MIQYFERNSFFQLKIDIDIMTLLLSSLKCITVCYKSNVFIGQTCFHFKIFLLFESGRSLVTSMLENDVLVPVIAQALGHGDLNIVGSYIRVSIKLLKKCAMEIDDFE